MPDRRTIAIHCMGCRTLLYRYRKGGTGGLVKCFVERIVEDRTNGDLACPKCGQDFGNTEDYISETEIFTQPLHLTCDCGNNFTIQAQAERVTWLYNTGEAK